LIRAYQYHTCGVKTDGTVACWGSASVLPSTLVFASLDRPPSGPSLWPASPVPVPVPVPVAVAVAVAVAVTSSISQGVGMHRFPGWASPIVFADATRVRRARCCFPFHDCPGSDRRRCSDGLCCPLVEAGAFTGPSLPSLPAKIAARTCHEIEESLPGSNPES
jgi:hypothetical protein